MISERSIHQKLGIESSHVRNYRNMIKNHDKYPSYDLMMDLLKRGGWVVVREMEWG
jgi:hypothetical protein